MRFKQLFSGLAFILSGALPINAAVIFGRDTTVNEPLPTDAPNAACPAKHYALTPRQKFVERVIPEFARYASISDRGDDAIFDLQRRGDLYFNNNRFRVKSQLAQGGFGYIMIAWDKNQNKDVIMKLEWEHACPKWLKNENDVLERLKEAKVAGIPETYWFGIENGWSALAMQQVGYNLAQYQYYQPGKVFTPMTTLRLAYATLKIVESVHRANELNLDIKPDNFMTGPFEAPDDLHMIDFGFGYSFRDGSGNHISNDTVPGEVVRGSPNYMSIHAHNAEKLSRRDDLVSWTYTIIEFGKGPLSWFEITVQGPDDLEQVKLRKENTRLDLVIQGLPDGFGEILTYVTALEFEQDPDYEHIRGILKKMGDAIGYKECPYDWQLGAMSNPPAGCEQNWDWKIRGKKPHSFDMYLPVMSNTNSGGMPEQSGEPNLSSEAAGSTQT